MTAARTALVAAWLCALAAPADAHFKLIAPTNRSQEDSLGGPQKSAPCGMSDSSATADSSTPTNVVSTLKVGAAITISLQETVFHPGHYRVALAQDVASLPADPPVTADGASACGSTTVESTPTMPVIGDGLLNHTSSFGDATKTMQVQLPAGMTCSHCVLQVIEFMSDHGLNNPGGCFYHHCAIVDITAEGPLDAGVTMGGDGDAGTGGSGHSSGGCSTGRGESALPGLVLAASVGVWLRGRRRRRAHEVTE